MSILSQITNVFSQSTSQIYNYTVYQLKHPSFTNVYYCVFLAYAFCFLLEVVLPKQKKHGLLSRKGFWLDTFYVFFNDVVIYIIGLYGICAVSEFVFLKILNLFNLHSLTIYDIKKWNPFLQVFIMFIIQDFCEFWAHYLLHRSDFLWSFHKIHHAQETLGAGSTRHFHFFEMFVFKPILYLPFAVIGYSAMDYFLFQITVQNFWGFFTHSNIKVKWGFLNYIFNTPQTHSWHHAVNIPRRYGVNYASILNIWDLIFGFYYLPKDVEPKIGVTDQKKMPATFIKQMIYPFKFIFSGEYKKNSIIQSGSSKK